MSSYSIESPVTHAVIIDGRVVSTWADSSPEYMLITDDLLARADHELLPVDEGGFFLPTKAGMVRYTFIERGDGGWYVRKETSCSLPPIPSS